MDMRYDMRMDGRRLPPRNARGEFRRRRRGGRDRGMDDMRGGDYGYDMRGYDMRGQDYGDYERDMARGGGRGGSRGGQGTGRGRSDRGDYGDYEMRGMDGHYPMQGGRSMGGYEPVEFMGYCTGYAGAKEDYGYPMYGDMRGRGRDRGYDMGYRNYDMRGRDYGYGDYGDYGETLSEQELDEWCEKLKKHLDEQEKQMFHKDMVAQKAKQMGMEMKGFGEKELYVATIMAYTDYKDVIGRNPDMAIRLGYDWLRDDDVAVKGAEKLAVYHDCIVEGEDD